MAEKETSKKAYNVKVAVQEVNGVLYRKTPPVSALPPPMVVHSHEDFAHHEEAVVSDSIFRQAVGTTLRSGLLSRRGGFFADFNPYHKISHLIMISSIFRPFIKGTRVRFQHHPVEPEGHPEPPVSALPPAPAFPEVAEGGEFYYKPVPEGSVPHSETYFKVGTWNF